MTVTLPSGRVVELREPTFGEELAVIAANHDNLAELMYAKVAVIVPGVTRAELESMERKDGRALITAVARVWDGRPEEQEAPFEANSNGDSPAQAPKIQQPSTA